MDENRENKAKPAGITQDARLRDEKFVTMYHG